MLSEMRESGLTDEDAVNAFFERAAAYIREIGGAEAQSVDDAQKAANYLVLLLHDGYDISYRDANGEADQEQSTDVFSYILCAVCPVKQTKANLHYVPEEKLFHDGAIHNMVSAPEIGFLFPAFDNRATNIYNALYYTRNVKEGQDAFVEAIFNAPIPKPAAQQKQTFEALLTTSLGEDCSMDLVQTVHEQLCQRIEMHKEAKIPEPLTVSKEDVKEVLATCGVAPEKMSKFSVEYDEAFGFEADLYPKNIIDNKRFEVKTPDVIIKVDPARTDLIETRVIGGVKYIMICADENVEVNGVNIHIDDKTPATV
jgi:hypothetical protein